MLRDLLIVLLAPVLLAQAQSVQLSRAGISGYVLNHGVAVPNVQVMARSNADRQTTQTDSKGHYNFFSLTPGSFRVTVVSSHLQTCVPAHIQVQAGYHYENADVYAGRSC